MAALNFEKIINLTTAENNTDPKLVEKLMIGNEPNNNIWQYYLYNGSLQDKSAKVSYSNYEQLEWAKPTHSMTNHKCVNFGIKTFPDVGAVGFYTPRVGTSKVLAPIHVKRRIKYPAATLSMTDNGTTVTFTIAPPADVSYICYRILLQTNYDTFEYITYDNTITIARPTLKGTYDCWCIGYVDEGMYVSEPSNILTLVVSTGTDVVEPLTPAYSLAADTYTKEEINQMIGTISSLLDQINGEVV